MLVLTRRAGESIVIGDDVHVVVLDVRGDTVRLGIEAPRSIQVHRAEVYAEVQAANAAAATRPEDLTAIAGRLTRLTGRSGPRPNPARRAGERPEADQSQGTGRKGTDRDEPAAADGAELPDPATKPAPDSPRPAGPDAPGPDAPGPDAPGPDAAGEPEPLGLPRSGEPPAPREGSRQGPVPTPQPARPKPGPPRPGPR